MAIELRILTGARGGHRERFDKPIIALGRHHDVDLRFDPNADLDVSVHHAEILARPDGYVVRDSGSTNGTFLNGTRLTSEEPLESGDVIWLGAEGPQVEVQLLEQQAAGSAEVPATRIRQSRRSTGERVRVAVREQTAMLRRVLVLALVVLVGGIGAAYWMGHRDSRVRVSELLALLAQSDSTAAQLQSRLSAVGDTTFAAALRQQNAELAERVRTSSANATPNQLDSLKSELLHRQVMQQGLALMDLSKISVENDSAIAFVVSELDGKPYGATAFGISSNGLLVTNKHNVR